MDQSRMLSSQPLKCRGCSRGHGRVIFPGCRTRDVAARAVAEAPWRSVLGPESRLPNVYWGAMSPGSLRRMSYYTALPPEDQVVLEAEATYRYVRQGTALWSALHAGRLTTSRLKDALGLRDRAAARLVGGPQHPEMGVLQAYSHLLQTPSVPPSFSSPPPAPSPGVSAGTRSETDALQLNEATRLQYNEAMAAAAAVMAAAAGGLDAGSEAEVGRGPRSDGTRRRLSGGPREPADAGAVEEGWSREDRRRVSELAALAVGAAGAVRMRLLWGSLQEASAVATLAALFPTSQLEEVGLLCLPDPAPWGVERGELPPIGASPDALVTHHVPITHADIQAAREDMWVAATGQGYNPGGAAPPPPPPELQLAARQTARSLIRAALVRHTQQPQQQTGARAAGLSPSGRGSSSSTSSGLPGFRSRIPALFSSGSDEAVEWLAAELMRPAIASGVPTGSAGAAGAAELPIGGGGGGGGGGAFHQDGNVAAFVRLREVVEVKNHCPFVYKGQRKAKKRGIVLDYVVRDRGPIESLWPLWVPQLQAHMACSGADSALLLSRSPSRGVRLFRMFRDDAYLEAAFDILRELQCAHVARSQPPGSDPWVGRAGYDEFVQRTLTIARNSETVVYTSTNPQLPGTDVSAFWDLK